ncbi:hypothetical protein J7T55_009241 [Diaporthe amygdali]|uniref:uncharacterized protein n=1 Tax=Phomopsis amygdali TaxID=1214568 RepID=UPI0022FE3763|nr:uncharacterized protein J7T55_009241 [Diaporthe amygdali]KAJ0118458.1 hypothetical protein J7T55_009241 [Diaporthe amygdali]
MEKTRLVYQLDTPFSSVQCLLSPIGQHRSSYIHPSKGKKAKVRKRKRDEPNKIQAQVLVPPPPAVAASVDVGLTDITRNLEVSSPTTQTGAGDHDGHDQGSPYSIVFVVRSGPPSTFFSHLPQMVAVASRQLKEPIRLVGFSKSCEEKMSTCLGIPRVSSVALRAGDSGQLKALVDFVRQQVPPVEAPWLEDGGKDVFRETKINTIQAPIGTKRQKKG